MILCKSSNQQHPHVQTNRKFSFCSSILCSFWHYFHFICFIADTWKTLKKGYNKKKYKYIYEGTQHDEVEEIAHFLFSYFTFIFTLQTIFLTCCLLKYGFLFCIFKNKIKYNVKYVTFLFNERFFLHIRRKRKR